MPVCPRLNRINRISPMCWKHINFYGEYAFRDTGEIISLGEDDQSVDRSHRSAATRRRPHRLTFRGFKSKTPNICS